MPENVTLSPGVAARWLLSPATEDGAHRAQATTIRLLSFGLGLMWLYNVAWKVPPGFGTAKGGLYKWTAFAVEYPVFPPYSWVVEHAVLPHIEVFGWGVLVVETALAVLLLSGAWLRLAGLLGVAQSLAIALSVLHAPHEWPWAYYLMVGAHLVVLTSSAGRVLAVDGLRARVQASRPILLSWGVIALITGAYTASQAEGDFFAARGKGAVFPPFQAGLGPFNLAGAVVLIVIAVLLLVSVRPRLTAAALLAGGLAAAGGLLLTAQIGFTDPVLGGTGASAALLLTLGLVGLSAWSNARKPATDPTPEPSEAS